MSYNLHITTTCRHNLLAFLDMWLQLSNNGSFSSGKSTILWVSTESYSVPKYTGFSKKKSYIKYVVVLFSFYGKTPFSKSLKNNGVVPTPTESYTWLELLPGYVYSFVPSLDACDGVILCYGIYWRLWLHSENRNFFLSFLSFAVIVFFY